MKYPKCGSELDTGFNCQNCDYKRYEEAVSKTELTTAEKLLWLAENESIDIWHTASNEIVSIWRKGKEKKFINKNLSEAIKQAYDWAKQEVTE